MVIRNGETNLRLALFSVVGALAILGGAVAEPEASDWRKTVQENYAKGLGCMKAASSAPAQERGGQYTQALDAFQTAKTALTGFLADNPDAAVSYQPVLAEINSCIYWCSKFRPVSPKPDPDKKDPVPKPDSGKLRAEQEAQEATRLLADAEALEQENPEDSFRIAIRYFEVADRFRRTDSGMTAMSRCLERMQRFLDEKQFSGAAEKLVLAPEPPAPVADTEAVEAAMRTLRLRCQQYVKSVKKQEELGAKLKGQEARYKDVERLMEIRPISSSDLSDLMQQRDQLMRGIMAQRDLIAKQDVETGKRRKEVDLYAEKVSRFGKSALLIIERYLADGKANEDMLDTLKDLRRRSLGAARIPETIE